MQIKVDFSEFYKFADSLKKQIGLKDAFKKSTKDIATVLLDHIKGFTPIDKTGTLIEGWNGNNFLVKQVTDGYEVTIVNNAEYSLYVNDGHMSYNQYGGPYTIHNRVKVQTAYKLQQPKNSYYVFGHFFVERGVVQVSKSTELENIIMQKLEEWWVSI